MTDIKVEQNLINIKLKDDNNIAVLFSIPVNLKAVELIKSAGARFSSTLSQWELEVSAGTATLINDLQAGFGASVTQAVLDRLSYFESLIDQNLASVLPTSLPLYPFQEETAKFMIAAGSALNANFVGSGKSLTTIAVCEALQAKRILIIAPKSVVGQWRDIELPKWITDLTKQERYTILGYERARIDIDKGVLPLDWDIIICDEVHRLASTTTKLYKALKKLRAAHRFGLSATPVMNNPMDLFGILNWIKPGCLGNWFNFTTRYVVKDYFGSPRYYRNLDELAKRCKPFIIKKTLEEVGMQLPEYTEEILPVELNAIERKNYDLMRSEMLFDILPMVINKIDNPVMLQHMTVKIGKLFEICDSMELIGDHHDSSKLEVLKEHLESRLANGEKAIIITKFFRMAKILEKELSKYLPGLITGETQNRQAVLKSFESDRKIKILIGTSAIEQGIDGLQKVCNILYNFDCAWNPARMEQRAGRIYRNGQEKPVFIYNLVCQKTVETWLQKKLIKKQELSEALLPKSFNEIKEMLENE